jgi:hypothetical protein
MGAETQAVGLGFVSPLLVRPFGPGVLKPVLESHSLIQFFSHFAPTGYSFLVEENLIFLIFGNNPGNRKQTNLQVVSAANTGEIEFLDCSKVKVLQ